MCLAIMLASSSVAQKAATDTSFTRKMLIQKALDKSYEIKNAKNEVAEDKYNKLEAYQTYIPNVSFNSAYTRLNDKIQIVVPPIDVQSPVPGLVIPPVNVDPMTLQKKETFKDDLTATMVLFTGMKVPWTIKALEHKKNADEALLKMNESEIINSVVNYYDMLALIDQSQVVLLESGKRLDEEYAFVKKARKEGLINSYDESKIEIATQQLSAKQIELNIKRKIIESLLNDLTDVDTLSLRNIHPELSIWSLSQPGSSVENRPELVALKESVDANKFKSKATCSNYMPTIYAFGKKELDYADLSVLDPKWYVGVGLSWKIFDGMQNYREIQKAKLEVSTAQNTYDNALSKMKVKLEQSRLNVQLADQLIVVAQKQVASADKGLKLCVKEYEQGLISITECLEAETDCQEARLGLIKAIYDQRMASIELLEATGNLTIENIQN